LTAFWTEIAREYELIPERTGQMDFKNQQNLFDEAMHAVFGI